MRPDELASDLRTIAVARKANDDGIWEVLAEAADKIDRLKAERLKLDKRIHNQRAACRITWEIVEMRRKWMGSDVHRRAYASLRQRYREAMEKLRTYEQPHFSEARNNDL